MAQPQTTIALLWDFDLTLSPDYMQKYLFESNGLDVRQFWRERNALVENAKSKGINYDSGIAYLNLLLRYVREGKLPGLSNSRLREYGEKIQLYSGLPDFFPRLKRLVEDDSKYKQYDISLEHYVISGGLKEMIKGSPINPYLTEIFASEFYEDEAGVINEAARCVDSSKKPEFIHLINKGANIESDIDLNGKMPHQHRRIPFQNMIYVGDGPSDVPSFATLNRRGGECLAVYNPGSDHAFESVYLLQKQERIFTFIPADYSVGSHASKVLEHMVRQIAEGIVNSKKSNTGSHGPKF
ncbi:MAG: HAD family hydrolase [Nanoarchaeota archaeon]